MPIKRFGKLCPVFLFLWVSSLSATPISTHVLGGEPVNAALYPEVIQLTSGTSSCTGTIIGPRAVLMTAHCVNAKDPLVTFQMEGRTYSALGVISPYVNTLGHDLAVAVIFDDVVPIRGVNVGGSAQVGDSITFLGYGQNDFTHDSKVILSEGQSTVTQVTAMELISSPSGPSLAQGDSGSPAFNSSDRTITVLGVGTQPVTGTNHFIRTDSDESQDLFNQVIRDYGIDICGVSTGC